MRLRNKNNSLEETTPLAGEGEAFIPLFFFFVETVVQGNQTASVSEGMWLLCVYNRSPLHSTSVCPTSTHTDEMHAPPHTRHTCAHLPRGMAAYWVSSLEPECKTPQRCEQSSCPSSCYSRDWTHHDII